MKKPVKYVFLCSYEQLLKLLLPNILKVTHHFSLILTQTKNQHNLKTVNLDNSMIFV